MINKWVWGARLVALAAAILARPAAPLTANALGLQYSTYLGGSAVDEAVVIAAGPGGHLYVAGNTASPDFPTTPGAYRASQRGHDDMFVARLDPATGDPVYIALLGDAGTDQVYGLAVDAAGAAYITGWTNSPDYPRTAGVVDHQHSGLWEGFVTKISPDGTQLIYSTFLGGGEIDWPRAIAIDDRGAATVVGSTTSPDFPITANSYDTTCGTGGACNPINAVEQSDAFVARLNPTATALEFATFLGGSGLDVAFALALDGDGGAVVGGSTYSTDFPATAGAPDTVYAGSGDAFVAALAADGRNLTYATYLGGGGQDVAFGVAVDDGAAYAVGATTSANFPATPAAFDTTYGGGTCGPASNPFACRDAFLAVIASAAQIGGATLSYATYLGGGHDDYANSVALAGDVAYITGATRSADYPSTADAYDASFNGNASVPCEDGDPCSDLFLTGVATDDAAPVYSTFLGSLHRDEGEAVAVGPGGAVYLAGLAAQDFPTTTDAYVAEHRGDRDGVALILDISAPPPPPLHSLCLPFVRRD
jgi:hypothetical protein